VAKKASRAGYYREAFYTKVIDISAPISVFESAFDQKTNYEIRRAIKDGVTTGVEPNLRRFTRFYNLFAQTKQLSPLTSNFNSYQPCLVITKATFGQEDIVMHAYITDSNLGKVRLLHSASLFRNEHSSQLKAVIGRANRLLHLKDMCFFKDQGFKTYDLGGYAHDTSNDVLIRINQFKDSFGGVLIQECDYLPLPARVLALFNKMFKS
jgi:hypothetical protein